MFYSALCYMSSERSVAAVQVRTRACVLHSCAAYGVIEAVVAVVPAAVATTGLPERTGTCAAMARSLATCFKANSVMVVARGPNQTSPAASTATTQSGLSDRNP